MLLSKLDKFERIKYLVEIASNNDFRFSVQMDLVSIETKFSYDVRYFPDIKNSTTFLTI